MQNLTQPVLRLMVAVFTCVALLTTSACRKCQEPANPDCENYDPCYGKVKADFKIFESYGAFGSSFLEAAADTIVRGNIQFVASTPLGAKTYEWHVGSDPRVWTTPKLTLEFDVDGRVPVTLIVKREPNTKCFPNDDGIDTIRKSFYVINVARVPWLGRFKFRGVLDSAPLDTFVISRVDDTILGGAKFLNLPVKNCNPSDYGPFDTHPVGFSYTKSHYWYGSGLCCPCNYETWTYIAKNRKDVLIKYRKRIGSDTLYPISFFRGRILP